MNAKRRFQLVLVAQLFTRSLPVRNQWLTRHKPLKLFFCIYEANLSSVFFLRRLLDTLAVLNSELFLHTDNYLFGWRLINAEKQLHFDLESVLFRNELAL